MTRRRAVIAGGVTVLLLVLALIAPEIYTGTFSDLGTFLLVAAVIAALSVWSVLARRFVSSEALSGVLVGAPALIALAVFVWPYVRPATEVDEAFPPVGTVTATAPASTPTTTLTTPTTPTATTPPGASTPRVSGRVDPEPTAADTDPPPTPSGADVAASPTTPTAAPTTAPAAPTPTAAPTTPPTTPPPTTAPPATQPTEPVELRRAGFQGLTGHRGSGEAVVYDLADGSRLLRFEAVDIGSGPRLEVYVVPGTDRRGLGDAIYVAPLTAERGNQNYRVPDGIDLTDGTWTVLVWCETFSVEVANATLA